MKKQIIFIDYPLNVEPDRIKLQECAPGAQLIYHTDKAEIPPGVLSDVDAIRGEPPEQHILRQMKQLKWIQLLSTGTDRYIKPDSLSGEIILTCATGAYGKAMSEYMIGAVLSLMLDFPHYMQNQNCTDHMYGKKYAGKAYSGNDCACRGTGQYRKRICSTL